MKCPECVKHDLRSKFYEHRPQPKKGKVERFYDEDGKKHVHAHTVYTIVLTCSNNHAFSKKIMERCPQLTCAWNEQAEVIAASTPISSGRTENQ